MAQANAELVVVAEAEAGEQREVGLLHKAGTAAEGAAQREVELTTAQQVRGRLCMHNRQTCADRLKR